MAYYQSRTNYRSRFSEEMLAKATCKIQSDKVQFCLSDITKDWDFVEKQYDLITFSLILEHIENLNDIFKKVSNSIAPGGYVYIGELHPFKQYSGSKAKFKTEVAQITLTCYTHNISDFIQAAQLHEISTINVFEYFDNDDRTTFPRILTLLMRKS